MVRHDKADAVKNIQTCKNFFLYLDLFNKITNKCYIVGMFATLCIQKGFNNVHDQNCAENFKSI